MTDVNGPVRWPKGDWPNGWTGGPMDVTGGEGCPMDVTGGTIMDCGPRVTGGPMDVTGGPMDVTGGPMDVTGGPMDVTGGPMDVNGPMGQRVTDGQWMCQVTEMAVTG